MSKELRPLASTLCRRKYQEHIDYLERNVLTKQSEVDTSVIARDTDEFYGKLNILGGQRQEKREGYNKFNIDAITENKYINVGNGVLGNSETSNTSDYIQVVTNKTYKLSYEYDTLIAEGKRGYCFFDENKQYISGSEYTSSNKSTTFVAQQNGYIRFAYDKNCTNIMLTEGSEDKEYEQYGIMPSLDYPSEIQSVGDVKYNLELGTILAVNGGNADNNTRVRIKEYIKVVSGAECIIDAEGIDEVVVFEYDKDKKYLFRVGWEKIPYTFNLSENTRYIRYIFRKKDNSVLTVDSVKDKSKHLRSVEITTSNKNMYDKSKITEGILISATGTSSNNSHFNLSDFIKVRTSTTYTFSRDESEKAESQFLVLEYDTKKNFIRRRGNVSNNTNKLTFITSENTKFVRLQYRVDYAYTDLQFEEEESRTDYIKHRGQTLIMPIQQKMFEGDTFEKIDGVWYEKHNWLELVLDEEKINKLTEQNTDTTGMYRYLYKLTENVSITDKTHAQGYCTHYSMTASSGTYKKEKGFAVSRSTSDKKMYLCIYDEGETLEEFKTKIANKEIKFYLQLEEPLLLKCTAEQSAILDKIDTYKDGTIITTDNDLCKISLRYKEDYDKRITALEKQINTATEVAESE